MNTLDIEENITDLLFKNKKLIKEDLIIEFSYNNEIFEIQVNDLIYTNLNIYLIENKEINEYKEMESNLMKNDIPAPNPTNEDPVDGKNNSDNESGSSSGESHSDSHKERAE
jgi:hypothetical protein